MPYENGREVDSAGEPNGSGQVRDDVQTTPRTASQAPAIPAPPTIGEQGITQLYNYLTGNNDTTNLNDLFLDNSFLSNNGIVDQIGGVSSGINELITRQNQIATGEDDPRFAAYKAAQLNELNQQRQKRLGEVNDYFARRGVGGSSAELNQENKVSGNFDTRASSMSANIGLQELARRDRANREAANLYGQRANVLGLQGNVLGQGLDYVSAGLTNLTIPRQLEIAQLAAENAGKT